MTTARTIIRTFVLECSDEFFYAAPKDDFDAAAYLMGGEI